MLRWNVVIVVQVLYGSKEAKNMEILTQKQSQRQLQKSQWFKLEIEGKMI